MQSGVGSPGYLLRPDYPGGRTFRSVVRTARSLYHTFFTGCLIAQPGGRWAHPAGGKPSGAGHPPGQAAFNAAKAGVVALAQTAALELDEANITVNVIPPSVIDAPATRARRHMRQPLLPVAPLTVTHIAGLLFPPRSPSARTEFRRPSVDNLRPPGCITAGAVAAVTGRNLTNWGGG